MNDQILLLGNSWKIFTTKGFFDGSAEIGGNWRKLAEIGGNLRIAESENVRRKYENDLILIRVSLKPEKLSILLSFPAIINFTEFHFEFFFPFLLLMQDYCYYIPRISVIIFAILLYAFVPPALQIAVQRFFTTLFRIVLTCWKPLVVLLLFHFVHVFLTFIRHFHLKKNFAQNRIFLHF